MRPRTFVIITLLACCGLYAGAQRLSNGLTPAQVSAQTSVQTSVEAPVQTPAQAPAQTVPQTGETPSQLPDDPGQELIPIARPQPEPATGTPIEWQAERQSRVGDVWTLSGNVIVHYRDYVLRADSIVYHQSTAELDADGHLQLAGGPNDVLISASHGDMRLNMHTARFYNVTGSQGVRHAGHTVVYSTTNPLLFSGRVLLQTGEGSYRIIDGSITNCRLPHPDWRVIARSIALDNREASTKNAGFEFLGIPIFYLPYLRHPVDKTGRASGFLTPVISNGSSIRGFTFGEQYYWAINRSMDMVLGAEYYSKRGWAPNGDFRYKGPGQDHLMARWNALLDRGVEQPGANGATVLVNQGGVDVSASGRKDLSPETRITGSVEYLSSYVYRLIFDDNYAQATSSEVASDVGLLHQHNGFMPSLSLDRFQTFASTANGNEAKILHLPMLRYDVLDRPLRGSPFTWGLDSSLSYLNRSEPDFHVRNVGRMDFYPHLSLPFSAAGWSFVPEVALRDTFYTISQAPSLISTNGGIPNISHDPLNRKDLEASVDIRPPALERDFELPFWNRELRHVIEPELTYRYVGGIGTQARDVLRFDTADLATDTNEAGFSLTQRLYLRPLHPVSCAPTDRDAGGQCPAQAREWASWQLAQEFYIDPRFGGALIAGRRNIFASTLDLTSAAFLTSPRNVSPLISRLRFDAINNLRIQWDLDYDPKRGQMDADNLFAGYSFGRTTVGVSHALLNAVDENPGARSPTLRSQIVEPFVEFGKPSGNGLNFAAHGSYDFEADDIQYGGLQAVYNWDCCGLSLGYRRFELGSIQGTGRNEHEWLYGFTLANFGSVGDIRRATAVFHDPTQPPLY
ncbi:MAG TPA: LPS assembly protein LptD [Terracidiphilus sp.]|nr:LPS assembly protein LptD [Terracidiphilus sp.]